MWESLKILQPYSRESHGQLYGKENMTNIQRRINNHTKLLIINYELLITFRLLPQSMTLCRVVKVLLYDIISLFSISANLVRLIRKAFILRERKRIEKSGSSRLTPSRLGSLEQ